MSPCVLFGRERRGARWSAKRAPGNSLVAPDHHADALDREEAIFGEEIGDLSTRCVGETRDVPRVVRVPRRGRHRARWAGDVRE